MHTIKINDTEAGIFTQEEIAAFLEKIHPGDLLLLDRGYPSLALILN